MIVDKTRAEGINRRIMAACGAVDDMYPDAGAGHLL